MNEPAKLDSKTRDACFALLQAQCDRTEARTGNEAYEQCAAKKLGAKKLVPLDVLHGRVCCVEIDEDDREKAARLLRLTIRLVEQGATETQLDAVQDVLRTIGQDKPKPKGLRDAGGKLVALARGLLPKKLTVLGIVLVVCALLIVAAWSATGLVGKLTDLLSFDGGEGGVRTGSAAAALARASESQAAADWVRAQTELAVVQTDDRRHKAEVFNQGIQYAVALLLPLTSGAGSFRFKAATSLIGLGTTTINTDTFGKVGEAIVNAVGQIPHLQSTVTQTAVRWVLEKGVGRLASFLARDVLFPLMTFS